MSEGPEQRRIEAPSGKAGTERPQPGRHDLGEIVVSSSRALARCARPGLEQVRLELAIRAAGLGLIEWDPATREAAWLNARTFEIFGWPGPTPPTAREYFHDIVHPDDRARLERALDLSLSARATLHQAYRIRRRSDGAWRWVETFGQALLDADGAHQLFVAVVADITERLQSHLDLADSEARFRALFNALPVASMVHGANGSVRMFNAVAHQSLGYSREEFARLSVADFTAGGDHEAGLRRIAEVLATPLPVSFDTIHRTREGGLRDRQVTMQRIQLGREPVVLGTWTDVTEAKRARAAVEAANGRLALALDVAALGTWDYDLETGACEWNRRHFALLGYAAEGPGHVTPSYARWREPVHPDDLERVLAAERLARDGHSSYRVEYRIQRVDNDEERWLEENGRFLRGDDGVPERFVGVTADVTDRKRAEQTRADADRAKDEFLAMLGHELRNPLAPIVNSVRYLRSRQRVHVLAGDAGAEPLAVIERQVQHLTRLVDDLLEVARITQRKVVLDREPVRLDTVVDEAAELVQAAVTERGQRLELPDADAATPLWLMADRTRLVQVVGNLLRNASKYTPEGGRIRVHWVVVDGFVELTVADDGIGIAPDVLPRLFELFSQADVALRRADGGLGVGLALVRRLVELHGGSVGASSDGPGRGSTFVVRLPRTIGSPA